MNETSAAKTVAGCLGLAGFAIALLSGLASGTEAHVVFSRAIASMFVCFLVGYVIGVVGERAVDEAADQYRQEHPVDGSVSKRAADSGATNDAGARADIAEGAS